MDIEQLRLFCLSLPATTESVKWGNDLVLSVGGKMYCIACLEPPFTVSFKVPDEMFEAICSKPNIIPAPYMARAKWVQADNLSILNQKEWEAFLRQSYALVKEKLTKKQRTELGI